MRIRKIKIIISVMMLLLAVRLSYIVLVNGGRYKKEAEKQQTVVVSADVKRQYIYDRKMRIAAGGSDRYSGGILRHVIGYTWDGGASGIEKVFNDDLISENLGLVTALKDAAGNEVQRFYKKGESSYSGIKLTIDCNIQRAAENVLDSENVTGAAIVVDAKTGGILAMASRPDFDLDNIQKYLNSKNGELLNRAICRYNPGSVFKIITAAAALETGFSDEFTFECTGKTDIDGLDFVCSKADGHGKITFTQGFAYSCNCLFYTLGEQTGYDSIREYARRFGLGEKVLRINGFDEFKGNIPSAGGMTSRALANISIGQGEVLATPLQIADVLCTVANGGVRRQLSLIGGIVDENGVCTDIKPSEIGRVISADTARHLQQMLRETVMYGTGKNAEIPSAPAAGKTATAETGWERDGKLLTHGWFAGYFPYYDPKYVCVVFSEGGSYGSVSAAPVFAKIGEKILDI